MGADKKPKGTSPFNVVAQISFTKPHQIQAVIQDLWGDGLSFLVAGTTGKLFTILNILLIRDKSRGVKFVL
jgi:hypothetical protein